MSAAGPPQGARPPGGEGRAATSGGEHTSDADTLVLGAGPAGLGFAMTYGPGCTVLEKSGTVGGLARTVLMGDGVFDIGGHSFHTPHAHIARLVRELMGDNWHEQPRDARVSIRDRLIPYPFQHHFAELGDPTITAACEGHRPDPERVAASANLEEWIRHQFGAGVAEHFMLPYNRKLWAHDLRDIAVSWVDQRIPSASSAPSPARKPTGARTPLVGGSLVGYPREGGFGAIFEAMAARCHRIELGQEAVAIDVKRRQVTTARGDVWPYRTLVSTMPLPLLLARLSECPAQLLRLAASLEKVSLKVAMLLVTLQSKVPQRVYVPDAAVPSHKIAFNHCSSPALAARPHHAVTCEVSYSPTKPVPDDDRLIARMMDWLVDMGFVRDHGALAAAQVVDEPFGYPIDTHGRAAAVRQIADHLATLGLYSIGRFGAWDYANSDECMRQGIALAEAAQLREGKTEHGQ